MADIELSASSSHADLGDEAVRRRLGPTVWKAFRNLMGIWQVRPEEAQQLVAVPPGTPLDEVDTEKLTEEQMLRICCLIAIFKSLHIVHGEQLADEWIQLPNTNVLFGGLTPLAYMIQGGIKAQRNVRKLIEARSVGN